MKTKTQIRMKKSVYKSGIILLTAIILSTGLNAQQELTKEYNKEYNVTPSMTLDLSNRYGDIDIRTSETDRVVIDVKVTLRYPNREKAERLLSYIDVKFKEEPDLISVKTVFDDKFSFSGWSGDSRRFRIDYNITMPEEMNLALTNRYGNTVLEDLTGSVSLDIKYGNLTAARLIRDNEKPLNNIRLEYGKGSVEEAGWLDLFLRYCSNFSITESQALLIDSRYSKIQLGTTSSLVANLKYDNLRIENINNLVLESGYTEINIGTLTKKLEFDVAYGSLSVDRVLAGFESIELDSRYTGIRLGIDESASYSLRGKVSYGGLKFDEDNYRNIKRIVENTSTIVEGIVGKEESPTAFVRVDASYGTVRLN
jgi:hypothetical protein